MVIFLARTLGEQLPERLKEVAAVRSERAQALAGVIYKAGRFCTTRRARTSTSLPIWTSTVVQTCHRLFGGALPSRPTL